MVNMTATKSDYPQEIRLGEVLGDLRYKCKQPVVTVNKTTRKSYLAFRRKLKTFLTPVLGSDQGELCCIFALITMVTLLNVIYERSSRNG